MEHHKSAEHWSIELHLDVRAGYGQSNKVSPWRDVTLLAHRRLLPPGELRCICKCYRRRQTWATVTSLPPTLWVGGPVIRLEPLEGSTANAKTCLQPLQHNDIVPAEVVPSLLLKLKCGTVNLAMSHLLRRCLFQGTGWKHLRISPLLYDIVW